MSYLICELVLTEQMEFKWNLKCRKKKKHDQRRTLSIFSGSFPL